VCFDILAAHAGGDQVGQVFKAVGSERRHGGSVVGLFGGKRYFVRGQ
jgi:hypothetical protein